jgi:tetratricopeptide (TPR) repeat protein
MHGWSQMLGRVEGKTFLARFVLFCLVLFASHSLYAVQDGTSHWPVAVESYQKGEYEKALGNARYVLGHPEFSSPVYLQKALIMCGKCYEKMDKPGAAIKAYLAALKQYGANEEAFLLLGEMYLRFDNPSAAVKSLRGALSMNHENARAHEGLAAAYLALGRAGDAKASMDKAAALGADVDYLRKRLTGASHDHAAPSSPSDE